MQTLSPLPSSNTLNLKHILRPRLSHNRVAPTRISVKCAFGLEQGSSGSGSGSSRDDWQISCANSDLAPAPKHGSQLRVAYQGVPGAYSEAAAKKAYPNCEGIPCDQFEVVFQAVEFWIADRAVIPVKISLDGSIHRNYVLLLLRHRLHIVGEVQLPVHHCLLALPGVRKEYLTRVISHPQALSQCEHTLTKLGLNVAREAVDDTAGAAEFVATNSLRDTAAIASARAADLYGLEVLADGIQDDPSNVTRFVMLAREPIKSIKEKPHKNNHH